MASLSSALVTGAWSCSWPRPAARWSLPHPSEPSSRVGMRQRSTGGRTLHRGQRSADDAAAGPGAALQPLVEPAHGLPRRLADAVRRPRLLRRVGGAGPPASGRRWRRAACRAARTTCASSRPRGRPRPPSPEWRQRTACRRREPPSHGSLRVPGASPRRSARAPGAAPRGVSRSEQSCRPGGVPASVAAVQANGHIGEGRTRHGGERGADRSGIRPKSWRAHPHGRSGGHSARERRGATGRGRAPGKAGKR